MHQHLMRVAPLFYRMAMLLLGNRESARNLTAQTLRTLMQSMTMRTDEAELRMTGAGELLQNYTSQGDASGCDFSEDSPLLSLLKLHSTDRCLCAMLLCGFSEAEISDVLDCTLSALSPKLQKARRHLTFSRNHHAPDWDTLAAAADAISPSEAELDTIRSALSAKDVQPPQTRTIEVRKSGIVQEFTRADTDEIYSDVRKPLHIQPTPTIRMPVWGLVILILVLLLPAGISGYLLLTRKPETPSNPSQEHPLFPPAEDQEHPLPELPFLEFSEARTQALDYADISAEEATFLKTKLCTDTTPISYDIIFLSTDGTQYEYILDAESGTLIDFQKTQTNTTLHPQDFLPLEEVRQIALDSAGLKDAIFTKEKLDNDNDTFYFKLEFLDAEEKVYEVSILAKTGVVVKYTVKDSLQQNTGSFITLEAAKQQALLRANVPPKDAAEQVIFTKEKLDGTVYLLAFTLEDGTQYIIEIDAETGHVNTVDVILVSADTSDYIGLAAAKKIALERTGLTGSEDSVLFTKAKIERSQATYVYELEFETPEYEYEVKLHTQTGEVLKYRALFR